MKRIKIIYGLLLLVGWLVIYKYLEVFASWTTYSFLLLKKGSHLSSAIEFFIFETPKVLMLLVLIVFLVLMLVFFVKSINGPMLKITSSLFDSSQEVNSAAQHISDASQLLAESANAQASSIEEILPPWRN